MLNWTSTERDLWFASTLSAELSACYQFTFQFDFDRADSTRLEQAWKRVCTGQQTSAELQARLFLRVANDQPTIARWPDLEQFVNRTWETIELPAIGDSAEGKLTDRQHAERSRSFDFNNGPLLHWTCFTCPDQQIRLLLTYHQLLGNERVGEHLLAALMNEYQSGDESTPINDQAREAPTLIDKSNAVCEQQLSYWKELFATPVTTSDLPIRRTRQAIQSLSAFRLIRKLPNALADVIANACHEDNKSLNQSSASENLLAGLALWYRRLTSEDDITFGVIDPRAGSAGWQSDLFPVRVNVTSEQTLENVITSVRQGRQQSQAHRDVSFGDILRVSNVARDPSRPPLVQMVFALHEPFQVPKLDPSASSSNQSEQAQLSRVTRLGRNVDQVDLSLELVLGPEPELHVHAHEDLFDPALVEIWLDALIWHWQQVFDPATSSHTIDTIPAVAPSMLELVTCTWNQTERPLPDETLVDVLERSFPQYASKTLVVGTNWSASYADLEDQSRIVMQRLQSMGVGKGSLVAVACERNVHLLASVLGVLRCGAAYVPFDPKFPPERLLFMAQDANLNVLLVERKLVNQFSGLALTMVPVDSLTKMHVEPQEHPINPPAGADPAYVIYTSGSTGKPKGVKVPHRAVVNFLRSMQKTPGFQADDSILAVTTLSFDISVLELLLPILSGGSIVLASSEDASDPRALANLIEKHRPTMLQATPTTWRMLLDHNWPGDKNLTALCGGEALPAELIKPICSRTKALWNMYGPTETTVWSTCEQIVSDQFVTVGRPIDNTQVYVLDDQQRPVLPGCIGEVYLAGAGVALGYLNRDELTAERFLPCPFKRGDQSSYVNHAMYRTGDLGRFHADGRLELVGRADFQVKVRGFRIELGEIEQVLLQRDDIVQCVVVPKQFRAGDDRLVAYLVAAPGTDPTPTELRRHVRSKLPDYMVPQHFVTLEQMPLTPNGKIDRKALPQVVGQPNQATSEPPVTSNEQMLAAVWQEVLGSGPINRHDTFFARGGQSILAMRVVSIMQERFGVKVSPRDLLQESLSHLAGNLPDLSKRSTASPGATGQLARSPGNDARDISPSGTPDRAENVNPAGSSWTRLFTWIKPKNGSKHPNP